MKHYGQLPGEDESGHLIGDDEREIVSSTPLELMQQFRPTGPGVCDVGCGVDDEAPFGCGGFGAKGTPHCTCSDTPPSEG